MLMPARGEAAASQISPTPPDPAEIERRLTAAVDAAPDTFDAHHALAGFYLQRGDITAALPHLRRAYAIDSSHQINGYNLALALLETGVLDEARSVVTQLLTHKESGELHNMLGDIEERAGNLVAAAEEFQRAAHMDATEEHLFDWGNIHLQLRAADNALQAFPAAVVRFPTRRDSTSDWESPIRARSYSDAVASLCRAVDLDPSIRRPFQFLGEIYGIAPELAPEVTRTTSRVSPRRSREPMAHLYYALISGGGSAHTRTPTTCGASRHSSGVPSSSIPNSLAVFSSSEFLSEQERYTEAIDHLLRATSWNPESLSALSPRSGYSRTGRRR